MGAREVVEQAFRDWADGRGHVSAIFAPDMTWEIAGRSAAAGRYATAEAFHAEVLAPFARRFAPGGGFRPVRIRSVLADGDTVAVVWDGAGTTLAGTEYRNSYVWIMRLRDGLVVDGLAFYDSIAFDELWNGVEPGD
jgi:ketosteroid isomerase-like protein